MRFSKGTRSSWPPAAAMSGRVRLLPTAARSSLARSWYERASAMDSRVGTAAIIPAGSKRAVNSRTRGHEAKVGLRQSHKRTKRVRRAQTVDANTKCVLIFMDKSDSTGPRRRGDRMMGWMAPLRHLSAKLLSNRISSEWEPSMGEVTTIGLDLAKHVFQVHGVDAEGATVLRKQLRRAQVLAFFSRLPPCLVGLEACATAHYWTRELRALGHEVRLMPAQYVKA